MKEQVSAKKNKGRTSPTVDAVIDYIAVKRWLIPLILIVVYFIVFSVLYPAVFLTSYNLAALMLEFSIPVFVIIGMAIQLINGEIDLSVGYVMMFANLLTGTLIVCGYPVWMAAGATLLLGIIMGAIVGGLVAYVGVNSFIATLGFGLIYYGLGLIIFEYGFNKGVELGTGATLASLPEYFTQISQKTFLGLQLPVYYATAAIVIFVILMNRVRFFRRYYYIGMNKEAADLSGVNVRLTKMIAFMISAGLASFAGILIAARMGSSATTLGIGMELKAITAVVIGGISFKGGRGTMMGAICGGLFVYCVSNGLRIYGVPSYLYKVIEGIILLGAVILDAQFSKRKVVG